MFSLATRQSNFNSFSLLKLIGLHSPTTYTRQLSPSTFWLKSSFWQAPLCILASVLKHVSFLGKQLLILLQLTSGNYFKNNASHNSIFKTSHNSFKHARLQSVNWHQPSHIFPWYLHITLLPHTSETLTCLLSLTRSLRGTCLIFSHSWKHFLWFHRYVFSDD